MLKPAPFACGCCCDRGVVGYTIGLATTTSRSAAPLERLRAVCLALPHAHEVEAWGTPTFRIKNKMFAVYASPGTPRDENRHSVWLHCAVENQRAMIDAEPARYFVPPYFGPKGWLGVWIDKRPRWREVEQLVEGAYRRVAPRAVLAEMDSAQR